MNTFSVIVTGKNEEAHLAACLRSVLAAAAEAGATEVLYVDAASTDRSVEIARALGVRALALRPTKSQRPAAARYVGLHHTTGELLMFVNGDTVLERQWLSRALAFFAAPEVAGVAGYLNRTDEANHSGPYKVTGQRLAGLGSNAVYRRAALAESGPFDPRLYSESEAALAGRLRRSGWKLLRLPFPMGRQPRSGPNLAALWRAVCQRLAPSA